MKIYRTLIFLVVLYVCVCVKLDVSHLGKNVDGAKKDVWT